MKSDGKRSASKDANQAKTKMTLDEFMSRELPPLSDIVTFCNHLPMSLYADSTVTKSPEVVFRGLTFSKNRFVSEEYLLNFRRPAADLGTIIGTNNYSLPMAVGAVAHRDVEEDETNLIALPVYKTVQIPMGAVMRSRRSERKYSGKPLSMQDLSTILFHAEGISGRLELANQPETIALGKTDKIDLRTTASGGALYPIDLYLIALNVDQLARGVYRYIPKRNALKAVPIKGDFPAVSKLAQFGEIQIDKANLLVGYVYNTFENSRKYGESGMAFAFIEVGAIASHIHLINTALGLRSCDVGSYSKSQLDRLFEADGISRHSIHLTVIGSGST